MPFQTQWGQSISVKSTENNSSSRLWCRITVPPLPDPVGKKLRVQMTLGVQYPVARGNKTFDNVNGTFGHT